MKAIRYSILTLLVIVVLGSCGTSQGTYDAASYNQKRELKEQLKRQKQEEYNARKAYKQAVKDNL